MNTFRLICLLAAASICTPASGQGVEETLICRGEDNTTIVIELWKPSRYETPLHCLRASFATDMQACAPQGGWGLGSNGAFTELVGVTNDWKTAHSHEAGKVIASAGNRGVRFNAHIGMGISSNLSYEWKFAMEKKTGKATWFGHDGHKTAFRCETMG